MHIDGADLAGVGSAEGAQRPPRRPWRDPGAPQLGRRSQHGPNPVAELSPSLRYLPGNLLNKTWLCLQHANCTLAGVKEMGWRWLYLCIPFSCARGGDMPAMHAAHASGDEPLPLPSSLTNRLILRPAMAVRESIARDGRSQSKKSDEVLHTVRQQLYSFRRWILSAQPQQLRGLIRTYCFVSPPLLHQQLLSGNGIAVHCNP